MTKRIFSNNIKGAVFIMLAMTFISCNDAIIKTISKSLSLGQILFIRGVMAMLIFIFILKIKKLPLFPKAALNSGNLSRAVCETLATTCFITALSVLPIATVSTLVWTAPIITTILAASLLKEQVTLARWGAVLIGFIGITFVTNPFSSDFKAIMFLPLLAAVFVSSRDIFTRRIPAQLNSIYITLATLCLVTCTGFILCLFDWRPVELSHIAALSAAAVLLSSGFFLQISGVRKGELSFIAPFSYTGIIVAVILGIIFWQQYPSWLMIGGIALIILSGLLITFSPSGVRLKNFRTN